MTAVIIVIVNVVVVVALCVSIVRFLRESKLGAQSVRRLAALSAAVTLLITLLIYSGEFRHQALLALSFLGVSKGLYEAVQSFLTHFDEVCTSVANAINNVLGAEEVGYRPHPPIWPAQLLVLGYLVRFLIYRFHTRRGNTDAALSGAVYWSHITTYVMVLAYLIVIAGLNPSVVVPVSLIAVGAIVVSVKLLIEDFGVSVRAAAKTIWTEVARAAEWIAYLATEFAGAVRSFLAYASRTYVERIREPLRDVIAALEERNEEARKNSKERLAEQNTRHGERFGNSTKTHDDEPPVI